MPEFSYDDNSAIKCVIDDEKSKCSTPITYIACCISKYNNGHESSVFIQCNCRHPHNTQAE